MWILGIILVFVLVLASVSLKVVRQSTAIVVERLGTFNRICSSGVCFIIPILERAVNKISLKDKSFSQTFSAISINLLGLIS